MPPSTAPYNWNYTCKYLDQALRGAGHAASWPRHQRKKQWPGKAWVSWSRQYLGLGDTTLGARYPVFQGTWPERAWYQQFTYRGLPVYGVRNDHLPFLKAQLYSNGTRSIITTSAKYLATGQKMKKVSKFAKYQHAKRHGNTAVVILYAST
ncbi:hypothetical protein CFAM422_009101 [Trichoderma lentiforme]|uniref:Uncharacterized protein n=1 Tax=Trichoderma lentiforme TaxID=1567552 RepID=A0A9P4X920_9HYPO|nr:hypothetical protein CFAM422_009101 [Trichoderma lentiforme]